jgi:L-fucose isomerase-like protein
MNCGRTCLVVDLPAGDGEAPEADADGQEDEGGISVAQEKQDQQTNALHAETAAGEQLPNEGVVEDAVPADVVGEGT